MSYALLQTDLAAPKLEQLKRAFKTIKGFTEADGAKIAAEAYGLLVKNLTSETATALQHALKAEDLPVEMVEMKQLPKLAEPKFVRRMELQPQSMVIYDPLGRAVPIEWRHLDLIAAGAVRHFATTQSVVETFDLKFDPHQGVRREIVSEIQRKVEGDVQLLVDILVAGGNMRFQIEPANFHFKYCFDRPELDLLGKTALLVQHLCHHAPQALVNRGAFVFRQNLPQMVNYASKAAMFDESLWLLWRRAKNST